MQKENEGLPLLQARPQPPQFSQFLDKKIYEKMKAICNENEIDVEAFITELLVIALNHHGKEFKKVK